MDASASLKNKNSTNCIKSHRESKPNGAIHRLIENFEPFATQIAHPASETVHSYEYENQQCYLLSSGYVELYCHRKKLVLNSEQAPFVFGFSNLYLSSARLRLRPSRSATLSVLPISNAQNIIAQENLWEPLSWMQMYITRRIYQHISRTSPFSSYETVRSLLIELMEEPDELRESITALQYIQQRSYLSRSGILGFIAGLRTGNYIDIANGKLLSVRHLPAKF